MPITFAHPVAVLPFVKTRLIFSALVIGSMSPDFIYFFNAEPTGHFGHTTLGMVLFCLPISILFYLLFHSILKKPVVALLPKLDQCALSQWLNHRPISGPFILNLVISILIGAVTHILWDGFTHGYGWAVVRWDWLSATVLSTPLGELKLFKLFQYSGHLLGSPLLLITYGWWIRSNVTETDRAELFTGWLKLMIRAITFLTITSTAMIVLVVIQANGKSIYKMVGKLAVYEINTVGLSMVLYTIGYHARKRIPQ